MTQRTIRTVTFPSTGDIKSLFLEKNILLLRRVSIPQFKHPISNEGTEACLNSMTFVQGGMNLPLYVMPMSKTPSNHILGLGEQPQLLATTLNQLKLFSFQTKWNRLIFLSLQSLALFTHFHQQGHTYILVLLIYQLSNKYSNRQVYGVHSHKTTTLMSTNLRSFM